MNRRVLALPMWRMPTFIAWGARMALIAMLAMSLLPTLSPMFSQPLRSPTGAGWTELCTAVGSKWVRVTEDPGDARAVGSPLAAIDRDAPPGPERPAPTSDHCAYCSLQTQPLIPALVPAAFVPLALERTAPRCPCTEPPIEQVWLAARPRGPPVIS